MVAPGLLAAAYRRGPSRFLASVSQNSALWMVWETEAAWVSQYAMSRAPAQLLEPTRGDQRMLSSPEARKGSRRYTWPRRWRRLMVASSRSTLLEVAMTGPRQRSTVGITKLRVLPDRVGPKSSRLWRRGEAIAIDHGPRLPAGHQHQLILVTTLGQPAGGKGVAKLVRVHRRQPSSPGPIMNHLIDPRRRHRPIPADPKTSKVCQPVPLPGPKIPVERLGGLTADRQRPGPAALAQHPDNPLVKVDVLQGHTDALGRAHAGVDQQQDDGGVAAAGEVSTLERLEQASQVLEPNHLDGLLGQLRRLHTVHRAGRQVALGHRPLEEGVQAPVADRPRVLAVRPAWFLTLGVLERLAKGSVLRLAE